ncbi:MAG TPA: phosphatase domain-containing protein [Thermoanaerobaculia bacterium]|nr:phosphatase domain-containing protein [Thermoanaerobaculia bacterium]
MSAWKSLLRTVTADLEEQASSRTLRTGYEWNGTNPLHVVPYRSFGTSSRVSFRGRVLIDRGIASGRDETPAWRNLSDTMKRLASAELARAEVKATFRGESLDITANDEGYFEAVFSTNIPGNECGWQSAELELVEPRNPQLVRATGHSLVPPVSAEYGVISDIDDTIVRTEATSAVRMLRTVLTRNARSRLPFEGVADFYRALVGGLSGVAANPIFYVSSGPWNLYDVISDYLEIQQIPVGPLMMQDFGIDRERFIHASHDDHKLSCIRAILDSYPSMKFVLIGDSGQRDPEIYEQVVDLDPGRILAIYIRDVTVEARDAAVVKIGKTLTERGVTMILAPDTVAAVDHATKKGLIAAM